MSLAGRHAIQPAQAEARGDGDAFSLAAEARLRDRRAQPARDLQRRLVAGLRQDHGKLLAADARYPVDAPAQLLLQPCAELLQNLIAAGVPERIVDALEEIDVAQDQRERAAVTRGALHFARKVLAEEAAAGDACQIIRGGELAVLGERDAQHRLQFGDAPRGGEARVQLALRGAPRDAVIRTGGESGGTPGGLIELRDVHHERWALRRSRAQAADQLQAVGHDDRARFARAALQRLLLIEHRFALEHTGGDALLEPPAQRRILTHQQRLRWRQYTQHDRDSGRRFLVRARQLLAAPLEDASYDSGLPGGWH